MTYVTLDEYNLSEGLPVLFKYSSDIVPFFIPLLFSSIYLIIMVGIYYAEVSIRGRGDMASSSAVAGTVTSVLVIILSLVENLISPTFLSTVLAVTILSYIWLFFSD